MKNAKTHGVFLRLLRVRAKDVQTSGYYPARGV